MSSESRHSAGKCIIVSAPSGAGKTTIVKHLLEQELGLMFSISATSRALRGDEVHGTDYHFMSSAEFQEQIEADAFVEWEEVYPDKYYGTLKSEVDRVWASGHHVIFDVDVVGGLNLKEHFGSKALAIFIEAPSIEVLEQRLQYRSTESQEVIQERVGKAQQEMARSPEFDIIITNDVLDIAKNAAVDIISEFLDR